MMAESQNLGMLLSRLVPEWDPVYVHDTQGPNDMASMVHGVLLIPSEFVEPDGQSIAIRSIFAA